MNIVYIPSVPPATLPVFPSQGAPPMPKADPAAHGQDPYDDCALNFEPWSVPEVRWKPHQRAWIVDEDLGGQLLKALSEMSWLVIARSPAAAGEEAAVTYLFAEG